MGGIVMSKENNFKSSIADEIEAFIAEKHSMGFKYDDEVRVLRRFDEYWSDHGYGKTGLAPDNLEDWCRKSDTEGAGSLEERISVIRQLAKYLNGIGISSYVAPITVKYIPPLPHLFTEDEIKALFEQIDSYESTAYAHSSTRIANEYPVLFRLIYLNGLRLTEACRLAASEVNLDDGVVTILDGKGNKDRLVYLSDDMRCLCREYWGYLKRTAGCVPAWFFPGRKITDAIGRSTVDAIFTLFWSKTSFADNCSIKPTVHDLRHSYVVRRINVWMEQGLDFDQMLPYLSKFLGHRTFNETYYYYHYAEEAAKTIHCMDSTACRVIPEVMRR